ncbi:MAG: DUF523 and DUF1722 domain-containing protein [Deltaproteobacteria bacterium]|nr:DUF523 and DUF1722 domain-containing protein [Deltaproteobacteria bacterium]
MVEKIKVGISECLMGHQVRYDGGHKWDRFLTETLGRYVEYIPVCPEVECGLGIPREAMRLVGDHESPRLVTIRSGLDLTEKMLSWAGKRVSELEKEDFCGFIFKSDSPSSGMERVKVYNERGMPEKKGVGLFARAFMNHFPLIPVEEEGRFHDPKLRENFIESLFVLKRWRKVRKERMSASNLVAFHTEHKLLILAHSPKHQTMTGKLVAAAKTIPPAELYDQYEKLLLEALRLKTTLKKHTNVIQHMMGYFKEQLSRDEKQELLEVIDTYRSGYVPLIVPLTLINHYVRKYKEPYLARQVYLNPHPVALQLRNHV